MLMVSILDYVGRNPTWVCLCLFFLFLMIQVGFPSRIDSPSCEYSRLDFDSDEDFYLFFTRECCCTPCFWSRSVLSVTLFFLWWYVPAFRAHLGDLVRVASRIVPAEAFQIASEWLQYQLASPIDTGDATCKWFKDLFITCPTLKCAGADGKSKPPY